jgi:hypothetical protein
MDEAKITVSMPSDAAFYLSMLLGDQLLSISDSGMAEPLQAMRDAYEHIKEEIERALSRTQLIT